MDPTQLPQWDPPAAQQQQGSLDLGGFDPSANTFGSATLPTDIFDFDVHMEGTSLDEFFQLHAESSGHSNSTSRPMVVDDSLQLNEPFVPGPSGPFGGQGMEPQTVYSEAPFDAASFTGYGVQNAGGYSVDQPQEEGGSHHAYPQGFEYQESQQVEAPGLFHHDADSGRIDYKHQTEPQPQQFESAEGTNNDQQAFGRQEHEPAPGEAQAQLDAMLQQRLDEPVLTTGSQARMGHGFPPSHRGQAQPSNDGSIRGPSRPLYWDLSSSYQAASSILAQPLPSRPLDVTALASSMPFDDQPAPSRRDRSESAPSPASSPATGIHHPYRHRRAASTTFAVLGTVPEYAPIVPQAREARAHTSESDTGATPATGAPTTAQQYPLVDAVVSSGPGFYTVTPGSLPTSTNLRSLLCMLALPNSSEATSGGPSLAPSPNDIEDYSVSAVNGVGFTRQSIIDFRGFLFAALSVEPSTFPASLPREDAIDHALVLIIALWMCNYVASQILASRTPITRGDVQTTFDIVMESVEVTVLLSIAAQVDLTEHSLEEVKKGWMRGRAFNGERKRWYKTRVVPLVKQKLEDFFDRAMSGTYDHILSGMYHDSICPDMAFHRGNDPMLVSFATDYSMSGGNIHLISNNIDDLTDIDDIDRLEMYTRQPSGGETLEIVANYHADKKDGKNPPRCWRMWRNKSMTRAASYLISFLSKNAAVALRRFYDKRNPFVDPGETMDYGSIIPVVAGMVSVAFHSLEHFGSNVTGMQLLADPPSQEVLVIKTKCVRAFVLGTVMTTGAPPANIADITWFSKAMESRIYTAICAAEGTRRSLGSRSFYITWDPSLPWTEQPGPQITDFLAYFEKIKRRPAGSPPPPWSEELRRVYEEAIRAHDLKVKQVTEASFSLDIIQMSHISPESAGDSWPALRKLLADALLTIKHDSTVADTIISLGNRPANPKRRLDHNDHAPTAAPPSRTAHTPAALPSQTSQTPSAVPPVSQPAQPQATPDSRVTATPGPSRGSYIPPRQRPILPKAQGP